MDKTIRWWLLKLFNLHMHEWALWEIEAKKNLVRTQDNAHVGYIVYMKRKCNTCGKIELSNTQTEL